MNLQNKINFVNFTDRKMLFRTILTCLLVLILFSAVAGSEPAQAQPQAEQGTIAYVRPNDTTGDEIHLIKPDGSGDRLLWRTNVPDLPELEQISALAWHPAASELAFTSRHEEACSFYNSDVYAIRPDGSGYRRVTSPPACGATNGLPTGTVNVYIQNWTEVYGPFYVYFEGAPGPQIITLAPGDAAVVTFKNVSDFGSFDQWGVVIYGVARYMAVNGNADVLPGKTVDTDGYILLWSGSNTWGWTNPTWKSDGSQISYIFNRNTPYTIPASSTAPGMIGSTLFNVAIDSFPYYPDFLSWAPPGPHANQLLYYAAAQDFSSEYIYLGTSGSTSPGQILIDIDEDHVGQTLLGLAWLPDSSGFLYSKTEGWNEYANIFKYSFATGTSTRLTNFTSGYPRRMSISPDGSRVVFEYQATGEWMDLYYDLDLWTMDRYGNGRMLFVQNARAPAWSSVTVPGPVVFDHSVFIPFLRKP